MAVGGGDLGDPEHLLAEFDSQRDLITAVATGTSITAALNAEYRQRRRELEVALRRYEITSPFRWTDLAQWWAYAKRWQTYAQRRAEVARICDPIERRITDIRLKGVVDWNEGSTTFGALELRLDGLKQEIRGSRTLDDWQDVGRRAREVIIAATGLVFDPLMVPAGEEQPKGADAKRKLDLIIEHYAPGKAHQELRSLLRAAEKLTQQVTHATGISYVDAFAAAQAAVLLLRCLEAMTNPSAEQERDEVT